MDSDYFGCSVTAADLSYSSYVPENLFGSLTFDSRNSPNPPFSTLFDGGILGSHIDALEQQSLMENFCQSASSSNCLEYYSDYGLQESRPSPFCSQESLNANQRHALLKLENHLMAPDFEEEATTSGPFFGYNIQSQTPETWNQEALGSHLQRFEPFGSPVGEIHPQNHLNEITPNNLENLLIASAVALSENKLLEFEKLVELLRAAVSVAGEPIQRVGAYMLEGLIARKELSGTYIYRSLKCNEPAYSKDLKMSCMHQLYEICPYLKFSYMAAYGAIAEACKNERRIHIIDFQIAQGAQWMTLLQALAARPSGAPLVRITGIDDPMSKCGREDSLEIVGRRLEAISQKFNIPVEFHAIPVSAPDITKEMLDVRHGEALVVNFPLQLHHTLDESVDISNPRDGILRMVRSLSPKVVTVVEQESDTNSTPFLPRFVETLGYYSAMFESMDESASRDGKQHINMEERCLARDIVNIIACEGAERVERHELLRNWRTRFLMAGFRPYPLSSYVNSVIEKLLRCYSENYSLVEKDEGLLLGWKGRNLVSVSAWH